LIYLGISAEMSVGRLPNGQADRGAMARFARAITGGDQMTVYHLSDDLGAINFNPFADVLVVDAESMRGVDVHVGSFGAILGLWVSENNHEVFLKNTTLGELTTTNFVNDFDGSKFIVGANNPGLAGDNGANLIVGTAFDDQLYGLGGADHIFGGSGEDSIHGGRGNDIINGNAGQDRIFGGSGGDTINGGGSGDSLHGDSGNDLLHGNGGPDRILGGGGNDWIFGDDGDDRLFGNGGNDHLFGGDGQDSIYGQGG